MARIELNKVGKSYGGQTVIEGLDLEVPDGSFTVFVGPSGCGKSTLLRMIAGLEEIDAGDVLIDGVRANDISPVKRGIAMVFQNYALYPHMTVAENIGFGLKIAGLDKAEARQRVATAAETLHIEPLMSRRPSELSGGQRQRVAIGRAIVRDPTVFLFDEPLSNLDAELRVVMRVEIAKLHRKLGSTMIYVTHDQVEAMTLADRIVVLRAGKIEQIGTAETLYETPVNTFVAGFIGSPRINFFEGHATEGGLALTAGPLVGLSGDFAPGETLTLGIRPENVVLVAPDTNSSAEASVVLTGTVEVVENLGGVRYVHAELPGGETLVAEVRGENFPKAGERIGFMISADRAHVFDADGIAMKA